MCAIDVALIQPDLRLAPLYIAAYTAIPPSLVTADVTPNRVLLCPLGLSMDGVYIGVNGPPVPYT